MLPGAAAYVVPEGDGQASAGKGAGFLAEARQAGAARRKHQLALRERESLAVEGVVNVESFDDTEVIVETEAGVLFVRGEQLHIKELNLETGTLQLTGHVHALEYAGEGLAKKSKGLLGKLFK
jgi:sporulation protein YabP|nr:sporulation protein YabP [Bacillota bacterium]